MSLEQTKSVMDRYFSVMEEGGDFSEFFSADVTWTTMAERNTVRGPALVRGTIERLHSTMFDGRWRQLVVSHGAAYLEGDFASAQPAAASRVSYCLAYDVSDDQITAMRLYGQLNARQVAPTLSSAPPRRANARLEMKATSVEQTQRVMNGFQQAMHNADDVSNFLASDVSWTEVDTGYEESGPEAVQDAMQALQRNILDGRLRRLVVAAGAAYLESDCAIGHRSGSRVAYCLAYDVSDDRITGMRLYGALGVGVASRSDRRKSEPG